MIIDLSNKGIQALRFDPCAEVTDRSEVEAEAAQTVSVLVASHNSITHVHGLEATFANLSELRLAHNALGAVTTLTCVSCQQARYIAADGGRGVPVSDPCAGIASWLRCLPRTLEVLDLSFNRLNSFVECTCGQGVPSATGYADETTVFSADDLLLRHSCPLTLALFFPSSKFPRLRLLDVSHNAFTVSLLESDAMEEAWQAAVERGWAAPRCGATEIDLSCNPTVSSVNCFLLCGDAPPMTQATEPPNGARALSLQETGLADLTGLSGVSFYAPHLSRLQLSPCPLTRTMTDCPDDVLADFLEEAVLPTLCPPRLGCNTGNANGSSGASFERDAVLRALRELTRSRIEDLEGALQASFARDEVPVPQLSSPHPALAACVYAALLREVIPSVQQLDQDLDVRWCHVATLQAVEAALLTGPAGGARHPMAGARASTTQPRRLSRQSSLSDLAAVVAPQLHTRVVVDDVSEDGRGAGTVVATHANSANIAAAQGRLQAAVQALRPLVGDCSENATDANLPVPGGMIVPSVTAAMTAASPGEQPDEAAEPIDCFTPTGLSSPEDREHYEFLCAEAQKLEMEVLQARARQEQVSEGLEDLKRQVGDDRRLIADQRRQLAQLRETRGTLQTRVENHRRRLRKRQKEIAYGVEALRSRATAAREQERLRQLEEREKAVERQERAWKKRMNQLNSLSVTYNHTNGRHAGKAERPVRSVVLREAAVRKKLEAMETVDPLTYTTSPFSSHRAERAVGNRSAAGNERHSMHASARETSPIRAALDADERTYFRSYESENGGETEASEARETAEAYYQTLSPDQRSQLRDALTSTSSVPPAAPDTEDPRRATALAESQAAPARGHSRELRPPPQLPPSPPGEEVQDTVSGDTARRAAAADGAAAPGHDLSTLSLTELFEAAASIRRRQLALQQLQDQWQEQKHLSRSQPSPNRHRELSPLAGISPATPEAALDPSPQPAVLSEPRHGPPTSAAAASAKRGDDLSARIADAVRERMEEDEAAFATSSAPSTVSVANDNDGDLDVAVPNGSTSPPTLTVDATGADCTKNLSSLETSDVPLTSRALF